MVRPQVTPLTEERALGQEHFFVVRPVRVVTVQTIFPNGHVFPQHGPSLVLVALVTKLVDALRPNLFRRACPVRAMAGGAHHFSLGHGHMRGAAHLAFDVAVTHIAGVLLSRLKKRRLLALRGVDAVTLDTGHVCPIVGTARPVASLRIFVALEARLAHLGSR